MKIGGYNMTVSLLLIGLLCLPGLKITPKGFSSSYMDIPDTNRIKGIFILMVFLSHFSTYVTLSAPIDGVYLRLQHMLGQLVVANFLFFSGFGIRESLERKGSAYLRAMPRRRILRILLQFDLAVLLYLALHLALGQRPGVKTVLLSLVGWDSLGNSNWYILIMLLLLIVTYIVWRLYGDRGPVLPLVLATACSVLLILCIKPFRYPHFYNTMLCYPAGMWFSYFRRRYEERLCATDGQWLFQLMTGALAFVFLWKTRGTLSHYELGAVLFAFLVVLVTRKVQLNGKFLAYCGKHLFSLYIVQRLPMIALGKTALAAHTYWYLAACFAITLPLAWAFEKVTDPLLDRVCAPKR